MIDRRLLAKAKDYNKEGDCLMIYETKGGNAPEMLVSGDGLAMLWGLSGLIKKMAQIGDLTTGEVIQALLSMMEARADEQGVNKELSNIPLPPSDEDTIAALNELLKEAEQAVKSAERERDLANAVTKELRKKLDAEQRKHTAERQELEKRILALDHEADRLTEIIRAAGRWEV